MAGVVQYGLTAAGFVPKTLPIIRDELNLAFQSAFGASIDLGDKSALGQVVGILAERETLLWEELEAVNSSQDPDKATGAGLDAICALTGTERTRAAASVVTLTLFGAPTTVVPSGKQVGTASSNGTVLFKTSGAATIVAVSAWVAATAYTIGNRVFHDTDKIYQCITAGTSAGAGGPTGTAADITDGTVHWKNIAEGVTGGGAVDVAAQSVIVGPVTAIAGDLSVITNAVVGWNVVTNLLDATPGRELAADPELRQLRVAELSREGNGIVDAITAHLAAIEGVLSVNVFVNDTDLTDSAGVLPHSVEVLLQTQWSPSATADQILVDTIFASVAAGIRTCGSSSGTATDTQGVTHTVKFSRPTEIPIYVAITLTEESDLYPADGDAQVKAAVVVFGDAQKIGKDAVSSGLLAQAFKVTGVLDVTACKIGIAPAPTLSTTIAIGLRELATYDTSRITITSSSGTP